MIQAEGYHPLLELQSLRLRKYFFFFLPFLIPLPYSSHLFNIRGAGNSRLRDFSSTRFKGFYLSARFLYSFLLCCIDIRRFFRFSFLFYFGVCLLCCVYCALVQSSDFLVVCIVLETLKINLKVEIHVMNHRVQHQCSKSPHESYRVV